MCGGAPCAQCALKNSRGCGSAVSSAPTEDVSHNFVSRWSQPQPRTGLWGHESRAPVSKPLGAIPGGWTETEWSRLTPDQQSTVLASDAKTQGEIRAAIGRGVDAAVALAQAAITAEQNRLDRERDLELARIRARENVDIARIQADSGQVVQVGGGGLKAPTPAPAPAPTPAPASNNTALLLLVAGGAWLFFSSAKGRRR